jgi:hypothetical protein
MGKREARGGMTTSTLADILTEDEEKEMAISAAQLAIP